ncbi:MAG: tRNA (adenosine(37)-N6)-dimethylallyltransferase MiaA [Bacteroidota bacterium]
MKTGIHPDIDLLAIVGHTAGGKTALAAALARRLDGEIISADSRQVYRGMDIGTGKDYGDYTIDGIPVPFHLIDIRNAGDKYSLFNYQEDFHAVYSDIKSRGRFPILCGGTGLYVESVLKGFALSSVPGDAIFRKECESKTDAELIDQFSTYGPLHNKTDISERNRLIRALEIVRYSRQTGADDNTGIRLNYRVFAVRYQREERRERIAARLRDRLDHGLIDEVRNLLTTVSSDDLMYYGLEYKYLTLYCLGRLSYDEMFCLLNIAICQFAKRQMTWFRGMEKRGIPITWIEGECSLEEKVATILRSLPLVGE